MRLSYVLLYVRDLEVSLRFYVDGVGLQTVDAGPRFARLVAPGDAGSGCMLALHLAGEAARVSRNIQLHFDVPDAAAAQREREALGVRFDGPVRRQAWGALVATAADPDGNQVEFVQWERSGAPT